MISPSVDGEAPSMLARFYGAQVVRGSGTYSGLRAVRGAHSSLQEGISLAVTPDGPRGPRFKFKPGAIFAAQISGKPVVPVAYAARPARILKTWDKFVIPLPFGRVHIAMGEPYYPPKELNGEQMAEVQRKSARDKADIALETQQTTADNQFRAIEQQRENALADAEIKQGQAGVILDFVKQKQDATRPLNPRDSYSPPGQ